MEKPSSDQGTYSAQIPLPLYNELRTLASRNDTTVENILSTAIQWQLYLNKVKEQNGKILIELGNETFEISSPFSTRQE
jgi:hypothetical protein